MVSLPADDLPPPVFICRETFSEGWMDFLFRIDEELFAPEIRSDRGADSLTEGLLLLLGHSISSVGEHQLSSLKKYASSGHDAGGEHQQHQSLLALDFRRHPSPKPRAGFLPDPITSETIRTRSLNSTEGCVHDESPPDFRTLSVAAFARTVT